MPVLTLKIAPLLNPERHATLARALTDITAATLGKRPEVTAVLIEDLPAAQWTVGARPVLQPTALLEISISAGTNTAAQKAAFVRTAFAELQRQLAPDGALEAASYVIVREVAMTDWGYGGQTQQARADATRRAASPGGPVAR
jgi:4-oxalocrotonate tautomerase